MPETPFCYLLSSPGITAIVAQSLNPNLIKVSEWLKWSGMKFNFSKTRTMIVSRSRAMYPQSPPFTISGTVLKESDNLDILGATFDSKMTFEKHLRLISRAATQRLGILWKS